MALLELRGRLTSLVEHDLQRVKEALLRTGDPKKLVEVRLLGPAPAPQSKRRGEVRFHLLISARNRSTLRYVLETVESLPNLPADLRVDVDPVDLL